MADFATWEPALPPQESAAPDDHAIVEHTTGGSGTDPEVVGTTASDTLGG